jgi:hypothetical protein
MAAQTLTVCPAPRGAQFETFNCAACGHLELGAPVFLTDGLSVFVMGSGCAARAIFGDVRRARKVRSLQVVADDTAAREEARLAARVVFAQSVLAAWEAKDHNAECLRVARANAAGVARRRGLDMFTGVQWAKETIAAGGAWLD